MNLWRLEWLRLLRTRSWIALAAGALAFDQPVERAAFYRSRVRAGGASALTTDLANLSLPGLPGSGDRLLRCAPSAVERGQCSCLEPSSPLRRETS